MLRGSQRVAAWVGMPSLVFAAVVFLCGWLPVSPFATWPNAALFGPATPAVAPFVAVVLTIAPNTWRGWRRNVQPWEVPTVTPTVRWREILGRRAAIAAGMVAACVAVSFVLSVVTYRGSGEIIDGRYVLTDHGNVLETVSRRDWLEVRTDESRVMTGHFVLFGLLGQLGLRGPHRVATVGPRPEPTRRARPGRPGGPRRHP